MFAIQQVAPPLESVFPTSVGGWVAMIVGIAAVVMLAYDRLRGSGRLDADMSNHVSDLARKIELVERECAVAEGALTQFDRKLSEVLYELRGVDGKNGVKGVNRSHALELASIQKRLGAMDVIAALVKAGTYAGEDRRVQPPRRSLDSKLMEIVIPSVAGDEDDDGN